jgi:hypothetical protein
MRSIRNGAVALAVHMALFSLACRTDPGADLEPSPVVPQGGSSSGGQSSAGSTAALRPSTTTIVVGGPPPSCTTEQGAEGILVDTFPKPPATPVCEPLGQSGVLDEDCPSERLLKCGPNECLGTVEVPGCCREDGECGLWDDGNWVMGKGLGCISRAPWVEHANWLSGNQVRVTCNSD